MSALIAATAAEPTRATAPVIQDQGTFTLYLDGTRIGEERFIIRRESAAGSEPILIGLAELNLKLDGRTMRIRVALETAGEPSLPRRYEAEIDGSEMTRIVGTLLPDRVVLNVNSPEGEEMKQFLVRGKAAILERHIAHHYYFASKLLGDEPSIEISVIVPRDRAQHSMTIEDRGMEDVQIEDDYYRLRHLTMTDETGTVHHVWLDGDRVTRVEVPALGFTAVRSGSLLSTSLNKQGGS